MYLKRASAYGTIAAKRLSRRGGMSFFSPLAGQPKKMTHCIMTAQRHDTIAAAAKAVRGRERTAGEGWL